MHTRVFVTIKRGLITDITATDPDVIDVIIIDYDLDATRMEETTSVPQQRGYKAALAAVSRWGYIDQAERDIETLACDMFGEEP